MLIEAIIVYLFENGGYFSISDIMFVSLWHPNHQNFVTYEYSFYRSFFTLFQLLKTSFNWEHFYWLPSKKFIFSTKIRFIYSEKATKFCKIFTLLLTYVVPVKILWPSQNIWTLLSYFRIVTISPVDVNTFPFVSWL